MNVLWYKRDMDFAFHSLNRRSMSSPNNIIPISQTDFVQGTYRITTPGYYQLTENIIFHPNPNNQFKPTNEQLTNNIYSIQAYRLGFFAAITIEADNVILDLNGFCIKQSEEHNIQQRFYANIEFGSSPFIPNTGPTNFGNSITVPTNVVLKNGTLGLSSHHGCHGNNMKNVYINNITFNDFEVSAISFNAGEHIYIKDCHILGTSTTVSSLAMLSQCLFALPFLQTIQENYPTATLTTKTGIKTIQDIIKSVETEISDFQEDILSKTNTYNGMFKNTSGLPDGNAYGISLNTKGPVVDNFKSLRDNDCIGNQYILIENVSIQNITSDSIEIIGYGPQNETQEAYGKGEYIGPVGDVIQFEEVLDEQGYYTGNALTDMQLIINKYGKTKEEKGGGNVPIDLIHAIEKRDKPFQELKEEFEFYRIEGKDSMGHHMKGNIGIFISQGEYVMIKDNSINGVINNGPQPNDLSAESSGILLTGTNHVVLSDNSINNIKSIHGTAMNIRTKTENKNIIIE